jgi:Hydantoinase/oxoprolinase N-terminal region
MPSHQDEAAEETRSLSLGVSVGESFVELYSSEPAYRSRWYLTRQTLTDGLKEGIQAVLEAADGDSDTPVEIHVASTAVERSLKRGHGQTPAIIVASGFETWFGLRQRVTTPTFTLHPKRKEPLVGKDFVFGISGRLHDNGHEESPIRIEELEFLKSKFELLKIQHVVVALPHADKNPEHELQVAKFFEEQDMKVFMSHSIAETAGADPVARWTECAELAYAELAVDEERAQIAAAFEDLTDHGSVLEWTRAGHGLRGGVESALSQAVRPTDPTLHLGLDHFYLLHDSQVQPLGLSASQGLQMGEWSFPGLSEEAVGLEPGPMLFGKSQLLSILDILFIQDRLQPIEGLTPLISEKSRSRIQETLLAWGKNSGLTDGSTRLDPRAIAEDIESGFIDQLAHDAFLGLKGKVFLQGALATTLHPLLRKRRPDLDLVLKPDGEWCEAKACLESLT